MKAVAKVILDYKVPEVIISHKNREIGFGISVFGRANFSDDEYDVFSQINQYWESLPDEVQDKIFDIYDRIHQGFGNLMNSQDLIEYISTLVADLMSYHDLETMKDWISFNSNIVIPDVFDTEYKHSIDNNTSREKTYIRSDYVKLVALSLSLRAMIPVWGEYISNIRHNVGNAFKEYYAFRLLGKSNIIQSPSMEKLKFYIEHIVADDKFNPNNSLNSISSEDFGYWLLALVCVRRLCVGDIRGTTANSHLITLVYKFIIQKTNSDDSNFENIIRDKKFAENNTDSDSKTSVLEMYKIKTSISIGSIVELEYSLRDIPAAAHRLSANINPAMLERSLTTCRALDSVELLEPQITLLRWVFKPVISPRGIMYLPKPVIVQALGALETILWARGHKYLAILASSHAIFNDEKEMIVSPVDSKMRVPEETAKILDEIYPYSKDVSGRRGNKKPTNPAMDAIDELTNNLMMFTWRTTCDESLLMEVFGNTSRKLPIKPDIKLDLTKLVIQIGQRNWL